MKLLLDTHVFLWYTTNDRKLPRYAFDAIRDKSNEAYLSVVSLWEALIKYQKTVVTSDEMFRQYPVAVLSPA